MKWLPPPDQFRERLAQTPPEHAPLQRLEHLARLAATRLSYVETIQVDAKLQKTAPGSAQGFDDVRLALLSNATVDHLAPAIRVAGLRWGLRISIYAAGFGQYRQELLDPNAALNEFKPNAILFSLAARDFVGNVPVAASENEASQAVKHAASDIRSLWTLAKERSGGCVMQQSMLDAEPPLFGGLDAIVPGAPSRLVSRLNTELAAAAGADGVLWLDIARASARDGLDLWFDVVRWLQAKMEIAPSAAAAYGDMVARLLAAQRGKAKKCLVLDLDDTLWGGVIGDDGIEGIVLGEGSGAGESHLALQRYALRLRERGVLLAVCSKNDPEIAEAAFRDHPEMALKRADFAAFFANWEDKAANLERIARHLNIGLDSLVFVDNNPVERARIRDALPMVATPELPDDPAHYVRTLAEAGYFEAASFTPEDANRAADYAANVERDALMSSAGGIAAFLEQLRMSVSFGPVTSLNITRVTQLINKTNQFNTTTLRRTEAEVAALAADPSGLTLQFRLRDKFGDNGIVSAMILTPAEGESDALELVNWVMSCRVFGRRLEHEAMNVLAETAKARGVRALLADYSPTAKNKIVSGLLGDLGFDRIGETANGGSRWRLSLDQYTPHATAIEREGDQ